MIIPSGKCCGWSVEVALLLDPAYMDQTLRRSIPGDCGIRVRVEAMRLIPEFDGKTIWERCSQADCPDRATHFVVHPNKPWPEFRCEDCRVRSRPLTRTVRSYWDAVDAAKVSYLPFYGNPLHLVLTLAWAKGLPRSFSEQEAQRFFRLVQIPQDLVRSFLPYTARER
jgi:hypothetical protein